jgi:hypothetical protein
MSSVDPPDPLPKGISGSMQVSIENQNGTDAVSLLDIRVGTVIGDLSDAVRILSARPWGAMDNGTIASLTLALEQERLSPAVMTRELVAEFAPAGVDAPDKKASFDVAIENVLAVLQAAVVKDARNTLIESPAMTVAGLDRAGAVIARRHGTGGGERRAIVVTASGGAEQRNAREDHVARVRGRSWRRASCRAARILSAGAAR